MMFGVLGQLVAALFASLAYAIVFQVPPRQLAAAATAGASGWGGYLLVLHFFPVNRILAMFIGGLVVGMAAEAMARRYRSPVTVFLVPGIIPLVPGADAYLTMLRFLNSDWDGGSSSALTTMFLAGAIAAGLIVSGSLFRLRPRRGIRK